MAKRKRLTPAQNVGAQNVGLGSGFAPAPETKSALPVGAAPISHVAGEAAAHAALADLAQEVEAARAAGRMIDQIPLGEIDEHHLVRDRLVQDEDEMTALMDSLRARGQQMPIEVVRLADPAGGRFYGLISGWRRLTALRRLQAEGAGTETVRALVIAPDTAQDAYVAMVEENEIRVNLSHYERARIAVRALRQGVYDSPRAALQGLYGSTTRSKRSKIGSFVTLVEAFDDVLHHPTAISEKLGLALVRELGRDDGFQDDLKSRLRAGPRDTAGQEIAILSAAVKRAEQAAAQAALPDDPSPAPRPRLRTPGDVPAAGEQLTRQVTRGIQLRFSPDQSRIQLSGPAVDDRLVEALEDWLKGQV